MHDKVRLSLASDTAGSMPVPSEDTLSKTCSGPCVRLYYGVTALYSIAESAVKGYIGHG